MLVKVLGLFMGGNLRARSVGCGETQTGVSRGSREAEKTERRDLIGLESGSRALDSRHCEEQGTYG